MTVVLGFGLLTALIAVTRAASSLEQVARIIKDDPIGMSAAARLLGTFRDGKRCHPSTITRWCQSGITRPDGTAVRLEHFRIAGRLMTSKAALLRFIAAQQPDDLPASPPRSPVVRDRAAEDAARELNEKYGI